MATRLGFLSAFSSVTLLGALFKASPKIISRISKKMENSVPAEHAKRFEVAKNLHSHSTERRRTARVALAVPLAAQGQTETNEQFSVKTATLSVSGHGGLITLDVPVVVGQTLVLIKEHTEQQAKCNIVSVRKVHDKKIYVGVAFADPACNFWHMTFTAPGARPLRRVVPIRISA